MGEDGYVSLTDFGLSKDISKCKSTNSICGTPSFMAPEIVKMDDYSYSVDWWALGVLTFLLIVGYNPFYNGGNMQKMFNCI
jgi:serine/threonine protein kinase